MNESTILYTGIFCFAMIFLGVMLTIQEFRKEARARSRPGTREGEDVRSDSRGRSAAGDMTLGGDPRS